MIPKGFEKVETTNYGPKGRGVIYHVKAENGITYTVQRHEWVAPLRSWAWQARPMSAPASTLLKPIYADTLEELEFELFPKRVEAEGR